MNNVPLILRVECELLERRQPAATFFADVLLTLEAISLCPAQQRYSVVNNHDIRGTCRQTFLSIFAAILTKVSPSLLQIFLQRMGVKEYLKSVNIWRRHRKRFRGTFFMLH